MANNEDGGFFIFIGQSDWIFPHLETGQIYFVNLVDQGNGVYIAHISGNGNTSVCPYGSYRAFRDNWLPVDTRLFIDGLTHVINYKMSWAYNVMSADNSFYAGYRKALKEIEEYLAKAAGR